MGRPNTAVLHAIGLGSRLITFIMALYANPSAKVWVNGHLSDAFFIHNGTQKACSLSPLLFILMLEPFLRQLRENRDIHSFTVTDRQYKLAGYADYILLFLSEPHITLPNLFKDF